jgi:hypothetical protein
MGRDISGQRAMNLNLTAPSSAIVVRFEAKQWQKGEFEAWREAASRGALADPQISPAAKSAFHFILWHVNRQSGGWALKVESIAAGIAMSGRHTRRGVTELESHGYLKREPRPGHSNFYVIPLPRGRTDSSGVGGQIRPGSNGTGRTDSSPVTYTYDSYLKGDFRRRKEGPKRHKEKKEAQATLERYRRAAETNRSGE